MIVLDWTTLLDQKTNTRMTHVYTIIKNTTRRTYVLTQETNKHALPLTITKLEEV